MIVGISEDEDREYVSVIMIIELSKMIRNNYFENSDPSHLI